MLKLKAENEAEKRVLAHLEANVSEVLREKINTGKKTMSMCWDYIRSEAKKLAKNGCACIDDDTVFGWAVHFFEEDNLTSPAGDEEAEQAKEATVPVVPKEEKVKPKKSFEQISFGDLFGG